MRARGIVHARSHTRSIKGIAGAASFVLALALVVAQAAAQPAAQLVVPPLTGTTPAQAPPDVPVVRIKDIARLETVRENQLTGLGLVVGLSGTGDGRGSLANVQMVANMLERFGISVDVDELRLRNAAAVMVSATLPPFARPGDQIDVTVSSFGDARSLQGGFLLQTPLVAANGQVYAVAQGPISIGGFNARGGGSSVQRNHPSVGTISGGAIVERSVPMELGDGETLTWVLREGDFTTAHRVAEAINERFGEALARAVDQSAVVVRIPQVLRTNPVPFVAMVEELTIRPDAVAQVVINERTGTVVLGHDVRIATVAVAHGGLTVRVQPKVDVSQPPPFSDGETVVTRSREITAEEERGQLMVLQSGASVSELVSALNAVGASPRDIIAILQAIKAAGALYGELVVM